MRSPRFGRRPGDLKPPPALRRCLVPLAVMLALPLAPAHAWIFADGFESGDTSAWSATVAPMWLRTEGNGIFLPTGERWHGRGANIHDTRSCWACAWEAPRVDEVTRRIDELVDVWGADFLRLCLESYPDDQGGAVQWQGVLDDPEYLQDVVEIVDHIRTKPGVYVLLSLWVDPTFSDLGWPTTGTIAIWQQLAETFKYDHHVIFGLVNEPQANWDGGLDPDCWTAMNDAVAAIRAVEDPSLPHLVAVQGTRGWARRLDYYVDHPITAGGGVNILYETHVYVPAASFGVLFEAPAQTLPVIIGEFGPATGYMTLDDCTQLMDRAEAIDVPYLGWTFHMRCPPNLLVDSSGGGCGVGMPLEPTTWGQLLRDRLTLP